MRAAPPRAALPGSAQWMISSLEGRVREVAEQVTDQVRSGVPGLADPADARLLVVDKPNAGKADAHNAGLNHSRYRYVCGVDADMVFARDALTRAMREIAADPRVVGRTSYFENARDPAATLHDGRRYTGPDTAPLFAFQTFDFLRSFFNNRTPWARMNFMLCAAGAFQLWRRDLVEDLHGWSAEFTCEDIEFTFRAHRVLREQKRRYRIVCLPDCVGVTEGPDSVRNLVSQRERWQRVEAEEGAFHAHGFALRQFAGGFEHLHLGFKIEAVAAFDFDCCEPLIQHRLKPALRAGGERVHAGFARSGHG